MYSWGWNSSGQLGVSGDGKEDSNDSIGKFGAFPEMVDFPLECDIVQLACGSRHSAAVTSNNVSAVWLCRIVFVICHLQEMAYCSHGAGVRYLNILFIGINDCAWVSRDLFVEEIF